MSKPVEYIRPAIFAGGFYPLEPRKLNEQLQEMFSGVKETKQCRIVISPHAGYIYSGRTAARAIASLKQSKTYIIIGPNHTGLGAPFSTMPGCGYWETPLGRVKTNDILTEKIIGGCKTLQKNHSAHTREHSIEVQLPVLQYATENIFDFVPITIMGDHSKTFASKCDNLGKYIADVMKKEDVSLVLSSDFSHYISLAEATKKDNEAIKKIEDLDLYGFFETLQRIDASICGYGPIAVGISVAKQLNLKPKIIHRSNSGEVTGDKNDVVSYIAIGFE